MTARGVKFLENWIDGNVTEADKYGSHERAKELAAQLEADAKAQGVALDNIEPKFCSPRTTAGVSFWRVAAVLVSCTPPPNKLGCLKLIPVAGQAAGDFVSMEQDAKHQNRRPKSGINKSYPQQRKCNYVS
jgi:hypothetical protein